MNAIVICLISALLSFVPLIELKGAIPLAFSIFKSELSPFLILLSCSVGGILSSFLIAFIFLFLKKKLVKIKFCARLIKKIDSSFERVLIPTNNQLSTRKKMAIVFEFCALPLPLTGVWASGALCAVLNLNYFQSVLTLVLANILSAALITIVCFLFSDFVDLIVCVMVIIFVLQLIYKIISIFVEKKYKTIVKK